MKAGLDIVLFVVTVYDYLMGTNNKTALNSFDEEEPQPDLPKNNLDAPNDSLNSSQYGSFHKFRSLQPTTDDNKTSLFDFDEEEDGQDQEVYTRLADDELGQWQKQKEEQQMLTGVKGGLVRAWTGAGNIMTKYAKRRAELNRQTIKNNETLTNMQGYMTQKVEGIQGRVNKYVYARRAIREMKSEFGNEFVTL